MYNLLILFILIFQNYAFCGASFIPDKDANGKIIQTNDAFATKSNYFFRGSGKECDVAANTMTVCELSIDYPHVKFNGLELINGSIGDKANLKILDTSTGTYSGAANSTLNQFGFNWFIHGSTRVKLPYSSDLYQGMRIAIEYTNNTAAKKVYINFCIHEQ